MPIYENPNRQPMELMLAAPKELNAPRRTITIYPRAWPKRDGALQEVEMDAGIAETFVKFGMISLKREHKPDQCESCRMRAAAAELAEKTKILSMDPNLPDEHQVPAHLLKVDEEPTKDETRRERKSNKDLALEPASASASTRNDAVVTPKPKRLRI